MNKMRKFIAHCLSIALIFFLVGLISCERIDLKRGEKWVYHKSVSIDPRFEILSDNKAPVYFSIYLFPNEKFKIEDQDENKITSGTYTKVFCQEGCASLNSYILQFKDKNGLDLQYLAELSNDTLWAAQIGTTAPSLELNVYTKAD